MDTSKNEKNTENKKTANDKNGKIPETLAGWKTPAERGEAGKNLSAGGKSFSADRLLGAAGLLMAISILSRLAGFVREQAIAAKFGTTMFTDAYVVAYTIVNVVYLILGGALATVFIPVFVSYLRGSFPRGSCPRASSSGSEKNRGAWELASTVINFTVLAMGILALLGIAAAPWLVKIIAPGFSAEASLLTGQLTRIMFPIAVLAALSMLAGGILNSLQHFAWPALSSVVFSLTVAGAVFTLGSAWGIKGLALGTVIATFFQAGVQIPALKRRGMRYSLRLQWKHPGMREIGGLVGPVLLGNTVSQSYVAVERILASGLATGSISALNFASKLMLLPFNLFAMAINTAIFPTLADHAAAGDREALGRTASLGIRLVGLLLIPAAAGMIALAEPLVRLAYERGAFNALSTKMTSTALYCYLLGLFAMGAFNVLHRAFYALKDTRTPVGISILSVLANAVFGILLLRPLQHAGLALAAAIAANLNLALAYVCLQRRLPGLSPRALFPPLGKMLAAALFMGFAVWALQKGLGWILSGGFSAPLSLGEQLLQAGISAAAGVLVYLLGIKKLNADPETLALAGTWIKKLAKK